MWLSVVHRDVLRRLAGPFVFCLSVILFLLLMQFLILYLDKIVGKGLPTGVVLELIVMQMPAMLMLAVPMSVLIATMMAFGRLAEQWELTALMAAGISPGAVLKPVLAVAGLVFLGMWAFSDQVVPEANFRSKSLFLDIRRAKPGFDLESGVFYDGISGYTFLARRIDAAADSLYDITVFQAPTESREEAVIKAAAGHLATRADGGILELTLHRGSILRYLNGARAADPRQEEVRFNRYRIRFDLSDLAFSRTNPEIRQRDDRTMSTAAMLAVSDSLRTDLQADVRLTNAADPVLGTPAAYRSANDTARVRLPVGTTAADSLPPAALGYTTLDRMATLAHQDRTLSRSIARTRETLSSTDALANNTRWRTERIAEFLVEAHKKAAIPFGCVVFALLGSALGMVSRKGNLGFNMVASALVFTFYWVLLIQGEKWADRLVIGPGTAMWMGNILLALLGAVLLARLTWRRSA